MTSHIPVLYHEALSALSIRADGVYLDCTFGRGGHSRGILSALGPQGRLIALDRDPEALQVGLKFAEADARFTVVHTAFSQLSVALDAVSVARVSGVLMDLGVSSPQLDDAQRGFSFQADGPLDMRMDPTAGQSAAEWLGAADVQEIAQVLWVYGEERFSRRIARAIVEARQEDPILTTAHLARIIAESQPRKDPNKHPATRSFQAIRLFINGELDEVASGIKQAIERTEAGGRIAIITFHSLEDRLVKRALRDASRPPAGDPRMPLPTDAQKPRLRLIGKAIKPSAEEVRENPRSRSAVLRVAERTEAA